MLTLILGRAGSGKTGMIYQSLKEDVEKRIEGSILIVPEQYSHAAERMLAMSCGDSASLYAEVLSFTRLSSRVLAETGGMADKQMDGGGRVLAMSLAARETASQLTRYNVGSRRPDYMRSLLATYDELRAARAGSRELHMASLKEGGALGGKLKDLGLIFESYEAVKEMSGLDAGDRLDRLGDAIGKSTIGNSGHIYIDGFTDFTGQEMRVIVELLKKGAEMTVCLTCDSLYSKEIYFRMPAKTGRRLLEEAERQGVKTRTEIVRRKTSEENALQYMERKLLDSDVTPFSGETDSIEIYLGSCEEECSIAAARVLELVRGGARFRDIAVTAPQWENYEAVLRGVFRKYDVPVNITEKSDILEKPVTAALLAAADVLSGGWDTYDVFRYLKTGMTGLSLETVDLLENYALKWSLKGERAWCGGDWTMNPSGFQETSTPETEERLKQLNEARRTVTGPLLMFGQRLRQGESAIEKVRGTYQFLEQTGLYGTIQRKRRQLMERGERTTAEEYRQLWDILVGALQQFADILGDTPLEPDEYLRLLRLVLSQYQVGVIPATVDAVHGGSLSRVRPKGLKHLIVLGASDSALPSREVRTGLFSQEERERLRALGIELLDDREDVVSRELYDVYAALTLPKESLTITVPAGERRSFVVTRLINLFGLRERTAGEEVYTAAEEPCFELAVMGRTPWAEAAREYFSTREERKQELARLQQAVSMSRGRLTRLTAERLYGREVNVTASRVDKFYSCRFSYFLRYGLRLQSRRRAGLDAPERGTFMHYVLERSAREIERRGGYDEVTSEEVRRFVPGIAAEYAESRLGGLENQSGRFRYLFDRLVKESIRVVTELLVELRNSQFRPMDFELVFSEHGDLPPVELEAGDSRVLVSGIVDRVDGWVRGDDLYLRVVDYKTGKKALSLSDIWYGLGMQMLIYLFALKSSGKNRYGRSIIPAGVLYAPARDVLIPADHDLTDLELQEKLLKKIQRSGLLLDDPEVVEAMEKREGDTHLLPVKFSGDGLPEGDCLLSLERLGKLGRHVQELVGKMGEEIRDGEIEADPFFRGQQDSACAVCDYFDACHFGSAPGDRPRLLTRVKTSEFWERMEEKEKAK